MSEIKLKSLREIIAENKIEKVEEKKEVLLDENLTWDDAHTASLDAQLSLQRRDWKIIKRTGQNAFKIKHDNGCVGTVVFDPTLKESEDEIDEAMKLQDIIKLLSDADSKLKTALKGFDEELYDSASIENDIDEVQSKLLKIINKLKSGNYNK